MKISFMDVNADTFVRTADTFDPCFSPPLSPLISCPHSIVIPPKISKTFTKESDVLDQVVKIQNDSPVTAADKAARSPTPSFNHKLCHLAHN